MKKRFVLNKETLKALRLKTGIQTGNVASPETYTCPPSQSPTCSRLTNCLSCNPC